MLLLEQLSKLTGPDISDNILRIILGNLAKNPEILFDADDERDIEIVLDQFDRAYHSVSDILADAYTTLANNKDKLDPRQLQAFEHFSNPDNRELFVTDNNPLVMLQLAPELLRDTTEEAKRDFFQKLLTAILLMEYIELLVENAIKEWQTPEFKTLLSQVIPDSSNSHNEMLMEPFFWVMQQQSFLLLCVEYLHTVKSYNFQLKAYISGVKTANPEALQDFAPPSLEELLDDPDSN